MRKQKLVLLLLFICSSVFAQSGWIDVSNQFSNGSLKKIYFFSNNNFLVTTNSNYCLSSTDMGSTWIKNNLNFDSAAYAEYEYSAPGIIFALKSGSYGRIFKSTNNGVSFDTINLNAPDYYLTQINFLNSQTGFVYKKYNLSSGTDYLLKTTDAGASWNVSYQFTKTPSSLETFGGYNFSSDNPNIGYATYARGFGPPVSYECAINRTTNGGITWQSALPSNYSGEPYGAIVYSDSLFVYFIRASKVLRFRSGYSIIDTIASGYIGSYFFKNRKEGFLYNNTSFLSTKDSCRTWQAIPLITGINTIKFYNNSTGFVLTSTGKIYKTIDGGVNVKQTSSQLPENFSLEQNYPNPFNPSTVIRYQLSVAGFTTLKVFDLLGKEVASLVNEKQSAGSYAVDFNSAEYNIPSGIYFYTLNTGDFKETKKMVLIK
jgi:photosystem II stability/assembly factor-like uncharacterized protein